ncbi:hypothetical protein G7067_00875 [Leucobacter insecticola]|uniref:Uncharacterized protein n=1 Tax=Leucobacter insecticola TaxID=2714934 RepID=A0A6G8FGY2_9MICO|nr:hypothetical protein [Leucobacter insecticola]QIM15292.1 hypothetical protein G7067_00875 [Leucobacter insecticola]
MAARTTRNRSRLVSWLAGGLSLAVLTTIAVVAAGYDAREVPRDEPAVWAMRSSGQYARVNTLTAEIDTVRSVEEPSGLLQSGAQSVLLSHGNGRAWSIDPTLPRDLLDDAAGGQDAGDDANDAATVADGANDAGSDAGSAAMRTPNGTRDIVAAGGVVLFRTDLGEVYLSLFDDKAAAASDPDVRQLSDPVLLDPASGTDDASAQDPADAGFQAAAVAVDPDGLVALYSSTEHAVHWYDASRAEFRNRTAKVSEDVPAENVQLAIVDEKWVLFDPSEGKLWVEGVTDAITLDTDEGAKLQASSAKAAGSEILVADRNGLWQIDRQDATRVAEADGVPAQPIAVAGDRYAAWFGPEEANLWGDREGLIPLTLDDSVSVPGDPEPVIRSSGSHALLTEVQTGMMWTVPDGKLIPVRQWAQVDPPKEEDGTVVVQDVTEQEPLLRSMTSLVCARASQRCCRCS